MFASGGLDRNSKAELRSRRRPLLHLVHQRSSSVTNDFGTTMAPSGGMIKNGSLGRHGIEGPQGKPRPNRRHGSFHAWPSASPRQSWSAALDLGRSFTLAKRPRQSAHFHLQKPCRSAAHKTFIGRHHRRGPSILFATSHQTMTLGMRQRFSGCSPSLGIIDER